eukprot:3826916-Karenia_brevis.AAC.1
MGLSVMLVQRRGVLRTPNQEVTTGEDELNTWSSGALNCDIVTVSEHNKNIKNRSKQFFCCTAVLLYNL